MCKVALRTRSYSLEKAPPISENLIAESTKDFRLYFKPLFEELDDWRTASLRDNGIYFD